MFLYNYFSYCVLLLNILITIFPFLADRISASELITIFDADQVCSQEFFLKMVPFFDSGDDVAMALSPQCFYNINGSADIFNHSNIHFWEYM